MLLLAPLLKFRDEIFSLEFRNCYDHLSKSLPFKQLSGISLQGIKELSDDVDKKLLELTPTFVHKNRSLWMTSNFPFTPHSY